MGRGSWSKWKVEEIGVLSLNAVDTISDAIANSIGSKGCELTGSQIS